MGARRKALFQLIVLAMLLAGVVYVPLSKAQTSTGQINISVMDPSGAVIPGATVTISGTDTGNVVRTLKTNEIGIAEATFLRPSVYTIKVSVQGFRELIRQGVILRVGDVLELPLTLETGSTTQQITVVGQTPLLEQNSGTLAQVVPDTIISQLPINGRDYLQLGNLLPGAVPTEGSRDNSFDMYGNSGIQNAFVLDGSRNESYMPGLQMGVSGGNAVNGARDAYRPPMDAIGEFSVNSSNYSAEYGAAAGAVIMTVTKSGTNQVHGSVYEYYQSNWLNARNFFTPVNNAPVSVYNKFGGSLGGPIKKDRIWIFGTYEGTGQGGGSTSIDTVPTAAMHNGNFGSTPIYDPFSTVPNPSGSGYVRTQFPKNIVTASEISAIGQGVLNWYPMPNLPVTAAANNYAYDVASDFYNSNAIFRGDVQLTDKSSMFGRFELAQYKLNIDAVLPSPADSPSFLHAPSRGFSYGYTRTFSTNLVNELRFSWTRILVNLDETNPLSPVIPGTLDPKIDAGSPTVGITGFTGLGSGPGCCSNAPLDDGSAVWDLADNVSKSKGKHLLKFGTDILYIRIVKQAPNVARGSFGFTGVFTQNPQSPSGTGNAAADLLLGTANTATAGNFNKLFLRGHYYSGYIQDDWRMTRSLTVNLGIRYELWPPYIESHNLMANFLLGGPDFGQYVFAGDPRFPRALMTTDDKNFAPRVGFAYRVPKASNLVVRGAFGIFYAQDTGKGINNMMTNNPPFYNYGGVNIISDQVHPSTGLELTPTAAITRLPEVSPANFTLNPASTTQLNAWQSEWTTPYVQEWNLTVEKQLPWNLLWQVSYVGNSAIKLYGLSYANEPLTPGPGSPNTRRPLAQYTAAPLRTESPWDRSHYEGLSMELRKRLSNNLFFLWDLTYSNTLNLSNPAMDLCDGSGCYLGIQNVYNLNSLMSHSDDDIPIRMVFSSMWNLPFGRGHHLANQGVGAALAGGWEVEGVYTASNGHPITPVLGSDNANVDGTSWPNRVCNGQVSDWTLKQYFNTSCFVTPAQYTYGNTGRNVIFAPGLNNVDFALHRSFRLPIHDNTFLQLRAEAFNIFNHPEFSTPGTTVNTATEGTIAATSIPNRIVQVAARITW